MKDGFDKNVAEKMPRLQKVRPNRPWNISPVQMPSKDDETEESSVLKEILTDTTESLFEPAPEMEISPPRNIDAHILKKDIIVEPALTETTLKEIDSQFTDMLIQSRETRRTLELKDNDLNQALMRNKELELKISLLQENSDKSDTLLHEVGFLNEQIQDANLYIQGLLSVISEKDNALNEQMALKDESLNRLTKISSEVKERAALDVKASMLERELLSAHQRIKELEGQLEIEAASRKPLEDEITELKSTLEKVHSSLAQIRLKAKREAYGL